MPMPITFIVTFNKPSSATVADCAEYITTALLSECGQRDPDTDPMFHFDRASLAVTQPKASPALRAKDPQIEELARGIQIAHAAWVAMGAPGAWKDEENA